MYKCSRPSIDWEYHNKQWCSSKNKCGMCGMVSNSVAACGYIVKEVDYLKCNKCKNRFLCYTGNIVGTVRNRL